MTRINKLVLLLLLVPFGFVSMAHASSDVVSQIPVNGTLGVATTTAITVVFNRNITATTTNISFSPTTAFTFATSSDTLTITPISPFSNNTTYTLTLAGIHDADGNVLSSYTSEFTTKNNYSISLYTNANSNLNLISLPVQPSNTAIASVLGAATSSIDSVWSYDPSNSSANSSGWLVYYPAHPELSNLSTMSTGYGYWITANANATLSGSGSLFASTSTPPSRAVQSGWNLLGYYQLPGQNNSTATNAFSSISGYTTVVGYDNSTGMFKAVSSILPGDAFWLGIPSSGTYFPSYSFSSGNGIATFGTPSVAGTLTVTAANDNPAAGIVAVASSTTAGVNLLSFNMKAENSAVTVTSLEASLGVTGSTVGAVVSNVKLMKGSTTVKTGTITNTTGTYSTVTFSGVDRTIAKDVTEGYWISVDLKSDAYPDGTTIAASTTIAGWNVSDTNGDSVTPSASVIGNTMTLAATGISIVRGTPTASVQNGLSGQGDVATLTIPFTVTAGDTDVYIYSVPTKIASAATGPTTDTGVNFSTTTSSTAYATQEPTANFSAANVVTGDVTGAFKVLANTSRTFTFGATIVGSSTVSSGYVGVILKGIAYGPTATPVATYYTSGLDTFKTADVFVSLR